MAKKKIVEDMTADELYALAQQREQEEYEKEREAVREQIEQLRAERRQLVVDHKKQLAALDSQIRKLGGRVPSRGKAKVNVAEKVVEIVAAAGTISTKEIKEALEKQGIASKNLSQTLAYLKRTDRVVSPSRSMYSPA